MAGLGFSFVDQVHLPGIHPRETRRCESRSVGFVGGLFGTAGPVSNERFVDEKGCESPGC